MNESILMANPDLIFSNVLTSSNLIVYGNTIIHGWLTSWTTWVICGILMGVIIWNIILSYKLKNLVKSKRIAKFKQGGKSVYQER